MNRNEAEQIALAVSTIRPQWLKTSLVTALGNLPRHHRDKPARDVHLALLWLAYDPQQDTPRLLREDGPWWNLAALTGPGTQPATETGVVTYCEHGRPGVTCSDCTPRDRQGVPMPDGVRAKIAADVEAGREHIARLTRLPGGMVGS